jgi:mannose-6-phosphate isomerase-like protein (cupin superfamily)
MPICLEGEIEFTVGPDRERFKLTKYDLLFIPANTVYEYTNVGRGDALFLGIAGCSGEWPIQSIYYLPGEDQPLIYRRPVSTD